MAFIFERCKKVQTVQWQVWLLQDWSKQSQNPLNNDPVIVSMVFFGLANCLFAEKREINSISLFHSVHVGACQIFFFFDRSNSLVNRQLLPKGGLFGGSVMDEGDSEGKAIDIDYLS